MKNLFQIPHNENDESPRSSSRYRPILIRGALGLFIAISFTFSLAASISIGDGQEYELGQSSYDVGTCATGVVQVIPKATLQDSATMLSQFTVSGINPVTCEGRILRILPYDTTGGAIAIVDTGDSGDEPDQAFLDIHISGGEFRASSGGAVLETTDATLTRSTGQTSIRKSTYTPGATTIEVFSGGKGRTLKSTEDALEGLAISFQVRLTPSVSILGYGRTDLELRFPASI